MIPLKRLKFVLLLFICANLSAQHSPFRFGVETGVNFSTAFVNDASESRFKTGYHVGVTADYLFTNNIMLQSGLFFTAKGSKQDELNGSSYQPSSPDMTHTFNQLYLELPIYAAYKVNLSEQVGLVFGIGPYLGYGVGGKVHQKLHSGVWSGGITEREWSTFGDKEDWEKSEALNRFDLGAGMKIDLEFQKYLLGLRAAYGFLNISDDYSEDMEYRNFNIGISLGYKF